MTQTHVNRAFAMIALLAIAVPASAHEGHAHEPNEVLHTLMHALVDYAPWVVLLVLAAWLVQSLNAQSDRSNRD